MRSWHLSRVKHLWKAILDPLVSLFLLLPANVSHERYWKPYVMSVFIEEIPRVHLNLYEVLGDYDCAIARVQVQTT